MHERRLRAFVTSIIVASGVILLTVGPGVAATCTLTAPSSAPIGSPLIISATGFPASAAVDISITVEGKTPDTFTTQSDAAGTFKINLQPEASDKGLTSVVASSGAGCTAQVEIAVGIPASESTPEPIAGGGVEAGSGAPPPTTDAAPALTGATGQGTAIWLGLLLLALGIGGLIVSKPARSR
jgi:hypothetical protein